MIDISKGRYWDLPWSLVSGCTPCSPGCDHCWALAIEKRFHKGAEGKIEVHPDRLSIPLQRRRPTVYAVWNDLFHEDVPDEFIKDAYHVMESEKQHTFLILTKRPYSMKHHTLKHITSPEYYSHIWHGLTICNQQEADEKIPVFLKVPGKKFLSIEPMLSEISLRWLVAWNGMASKPRPSTTNHLDGLRLFDAVILGGETGPGARPMHPDWVRSVRDQCAEAGVPFFFKQWGEYADLTNDENGSERREREAAGSNPFIKTKKPW